jgi:hypothetical protein
MSDTHARIDALIDLTSNPADRLWRYPICHAMVKYVMNTPITPNHVTGFHTLLGIASGVVIAEGTPRAFVLAGVMYEVRAILDCFDGVVARAKKLSSPLGRTLDQLGDGIGFVSLMVGGAVCFARIYGWITAIAIVTVTTAVSALCTTAWDFFKRRFTSLIKHGYDNTEDEYVALCRQYEATPTVSFWFSRLVATYQWLTLSPQTLARMRERLARNDLVGEGEGTPTPVGRAVQEAAHRNDPELRAMLLRVGVVAGDNVILLLTVALLVGRYLEAFPFAMLWSVVIWVYTVASANRYLNDVARAPVIVER